jgi:hypothetical protein
MFVKMIRFPLLVVISGLKPKIGHENKFALSISGHWNPEKNL